MTEIETIDDILTHFGKRGMHWGIRNKIDSIRSTAPTEVTVKTRPGHKIKTSGGKGQSASADALKVATSKQMARKSSTDSLSTKDLQEMVNRLNLEQQYSRLDPTMKTRGQAFVGEVIKSEGPKLVVAGAAHYLKDSSNPQAQMGLKFADAFVNKGKKKKK
jgi:hypothetical protein